MQRHTQAAQESAAQLSIMWAPAPPPDPTPPAPPPQPAPMVAEASPDVLALYVASLWERRLSPLTIRGYQLELENLQRIVGAPLARIGRAQMRLAWQAACASGVKAATLGRKLIAWRCAWKWASEAEPPLPLVDPRPYRGIVVPKGEKRVRAYLTEDQARQLAAALRGGGWFQAREAAIVAILLWTGARCAEVAGLTVEAVRLGADPFVRLYGKGRKERDVPLPAPAVPWVTGWLDHHPTGHGPLFVDPDGKAFDTGRVRSTLARVRDRAGLRHTGITPHGLRHTYATRLVNAEVPILQVQQLLGHASVATTQIYAHAVLSASTRDALNRM